MFVLALIMAVLGGGVAPAGLRDEPTGPTGPSGPSGPTGATGPTGPTGPAEGSGPAVRLRVVRDQTIADVNRNGLRVRARCRRSCAVRVRVLKDFVLFGTGTRVLRSRHGLVTIRFNARHRRTLARKRRVRLLLVAQAYGADTASGPEFRRVYTLKRR